MTTYFVGTCSWTDKTLLTEGNFYPPTVKNAAERLQFYASCFNTVEVDSSFYAFPSERNTRLWVERTPPNFLFNLKAFSLLTFHNTTTRNIPSFLLSELPGNAQEEDSLNARTLSREFLSLGLQAFLKSTLPLQESQKLGYILFQFPPWFQEGKDTIAYLEWLREHTEGFPVAIEFRHRSWLEDAVRGETFALLQRLRFTYVCVDEPQLPWTVPPVVARTTSTMVIRFHGRNTAAWKDHNASIWEKFNYLYQEKELKQWLRVLQGPSKEAETVFLMFNNCFRDYAVRNARMVQALLTPPDHPV
ncbi:MAG: DUF72 domain-containing protein [Candidatus Atribacteria bacterium]|nr:DUF72 domain-containing protein [Candidatus Atribacteria bacterium]